MSLDKINARTALDSFKSSKSAVEINSGKQLQNSEDTKKLKSACQGFEAVFLNYLLGKMREAVQTSDPTESSFGEKMYQSMLDESIAQEGAKQGGFGIGEMLYRQLTANGATSEKGTKIDSTR